MIGRILGIDRSAVKRHFQKDAGHWDEASQNGRLSILSDEEHEDRIRTITEAYQMRRPMSIGEFSYHIETRFQKSIERNTLWYMLRRDTRIKSCRGVPMEEPRLDVPIEAILTFFQQAIQIIDGVPAHFVFNMDEMGRNEPFYNSFRIVETSCEMRLQSQRMAKQSESISMADDV
jgi:hypothetical protein